MNIAQNNKIIKIVVLTTLLIISFVPIYFIHYRAVKASYYHYWGINYYLNGLKDLSWQYWQMALQTDNPYSSGPRIDFATMLEQGYQAGIIFEPIAENHKLGIAEMKKVIAREPENYFPHHYLSEYYNVFADFDARYLDEAEKEAQKAWELSPNRQQILYSMSKTALLRGQKEKGFALFKQAVELNPLAGDPHFFYGMLALSVGNKELGLAEIERAEQLGRLPRNMKEYIALGNLVGDAGHYKKAIELYREGLKLTSDPNYKIWSMDLRLKIAIAYYLSNQKEEARQTFVDLVKEVDLKISPVYPQIKQIMEELGI